jgi:flagellar biosynthetic protein FliP
MWLVDLGSFSAVIAVGKMDLWVSRIIRSTAILTVLIIPSLAWSADPFSIPAVTVSQNSDGQPVYSISLQILAIMTLLTVLPSILMTMTAFTRIIIVFSLLRQAIGLQQTPSNQILLGLALFLTLFIMSPVIKSINQNAVQPYISEDISFEDAIQRSAVPVRAFMVKQIRTSDLELFIRIAKEEGRYKSIDEVPMTLIIPSFVTSELKTAFQVGFMLFIPFLIIDLVVASVLMAMGMMMLSPLIVSWPFKVMLFVFIDGWAMLVGSLAESYG